MADEPCVWLTGLKMKIYNYPDWDQNEETGYLTYKTSTPTTTNHVNPWYWRTVNLTQTWISEHHESIFSIGTQWHHHMDQMPSSLSKLYSVLCVTKFPNLP